MEPASVGSSPTFQEDFNSTRFSVQPGVTSPRSHVKDFLSTMNMANEDGPPLGAVHEGQEVDLEPSESEFFDLHPPPSSASHVKVEDITKRLFSEEHLHFILQDHGLFYRFSTFLNRAKPHLVPTLVRYIEMRKAMKAIDYANAVAKSIRWPSHTDYCKFSRVKAAVVDVRFEDYAKRELQLLTSEALPAFVTQTLIDVVQDLVAKDITGQVVPALQHLVGNLAEVFCLTDPSTHDNPIIYASEEFHKTTQYGTTYAIDRNCRFLQGPATDRSTTKRLAETIVRGQESNETILNYRRDGTPFVNLLMCSPLYDDKGVVRYFIGAQVDVTALVETGAGVDSFARLLASTASKSKAEDSGNHYNPTQKNEYLDRKAREAADVLKDLSAMLSQDEAEIVVQNLRGGGACDDDDSESVRSVAPTTKNRGKAKRVIGSFDGELNALSLQQLNFAKSPNGYSSTHSTLPGVYKHYLLVRPYPSLQIIFVSPALRLPGLLRTHLFSKLGGPDKTMTELEMALRDGVGVTAKVMWVPRAVGRGEARPRWIRCTPLLGSDDRVGVWMMVLVPVEPEGHGHIGGNFERGRRFWPEARGYEESRSGSVQATSRMGSINGEDGGFGLRRREASVAGMRREENGVKEDADTYAGYLRSSSSTGGSRDGIGGVGIPRRGMGET